MPEPTEALNTRISLPAAAALRALAVYWDLSKRATIERLIAEAVRQEEVPHA